MDELVECLLADLSHNLDRLADALDEQQPTLARLLRREASGVAPTEILGASEPAARRLRPRALRPVLYRALEAGAVDAGKFDRLMLLAARGRRR